METPSSENASAVFATLLDHASVSFDLPAKVSLCAACVAVDRTLRDRCVHLLAILAARKDGAAESRILERAALRDDDARLLAFRHHGREMLPDAARALARTAASHGCLRVVAWALDRGAPIHDDCLIDEASRDGFWTCVRWLCGRAARRGARRPAHTSPVEGTSRS